VVVIGNLLRLLLLLLPGLLISHDISFPLLTFSPPGMLLAVMLVLVWLKIGGRVDSYITSPYSWAPLWQPLITWLLLMAYPAPTNSSPAFAETAMVGGFATGEEETRSRGGGGVVGSSSRWWKSQ